MSYLLTNISNQTSKGSQLTNQQSRLFKIGICGELDNKFDFKKLNKASMKNFHNFIKETVGKELSITEVDSLYLRTKGQISTKETIHGGERDIIHYGKDMKPFRIFGYYNEDGYFTITRIDANHKTHR